MIKTRDLYWDTLKLLLIFLVFYGHVVQPYREGSLFNMTAFNYIYTFHMPLFAFISGRFSRFSDCQKYKRSILRIFETLVIVHLIRCTMIVLLGSGFNLGMLTTPSFALWYLAALIYWRLLILVVPKKWERNPIIMISVSVLISMLAPFIPTFIGKHFVIERSLNFLPFFIMGYFSVKIDIKKLIAKVNAKLAWGYLVLLFMALYFALQYVSINTATIVHSSWSYWTGSIMEISLRVVYIPLTIITSIMIMRSVPVWKPVAKLGGGISMFIYIYHMFMIDVLKYGVSQGYLRSDEISLILFTIVSFCLLILLSRIKLFTYILNPISTLFNKTGYIK